MNEVKLTEKFAIDVEGIVTAYLDRINKPLPPIVYESHPNSIYLCPTCHSTWTIDAFKHPYKYCGNCGQRLNFKGIKL